eukprot:symbB.v1.2.022686.t2/scaffold2031.1/size91907/3
MLCSTCLQFQVPCANWHGYTIVDISRSMKMCKKELKVFQLPFRNSSLVDTWERCYAKLHRRKKSKHRMDHVGPKWPIGELETLDFSDPHSIHFSDLKAKQQNGRSRTYASGGLATVISGGYPLVATTGPSNAWIANRLIEREKARIEKKYDEADKLRKLLRTNGIEVDDRDRSWTSRDGRRGPRPNHNDPMEEENEGATLISASQLSSLLPQMSMPALATAVPAVPAES